MILMVIFAWLIASAYGDTCAKYFTYIGGNEGILTIPPFQSYEHQLSVIVSYSGQLFSKYVGDLGLEKGSKVTTNNLANGIPLRYKIRVPVIKPSPIISEIVYNGKTICYDVKKLTLTTHVTLTNNFKTTVLFPIKTSVRTETPRISQSSRSHNNVQCGIRKSSDLVASGLVINGLKSPRAGFPWLAAHYHTSKHFICGGSLVSHRIIVTAAHCIWNKGDVAPITAYESTYYLGKHKLKDLDENDYVSSDVQKFKIHPNWSTTNKKYDSDIALAVLTKNIQFTNTVRPICVYSGTPGHSDIVNREGYIAGWGISQRHTRSASEIPMYVVLPVVDDTVCLRSNNVFWQISSPKTFCVGDKSGRTPCQGDSGGAFAVKHGNQFYLRGIVSAALLTDNGQCSNTDYSLLTDTSYFSDWINQNINKYG